MMIGYGSGARPVPSESGRAREIFAWRMFLSANRHPPPDQVRGRLSPEHALGEALDEIARAPPHAGTRPGVLTLAHDDVVGLQDVPAERVTAAPQIDAERPIGLLVPPRDDLVARGIETLGPVPHRELVVVRLALDLHDLETVVDEFLDHVGQRHEAVRGVP